MKSSLVSPLLFACLCVPLGLPIAHAHPLAPPANQENDAPEKQARDADDSGTTDPAALKVTDDTTDWITVKPTGAAAEIKMPTDPRYVERMFTPVENQPAIKVRMHLGSFNRGAGVFVFSYHDLNSAPATPKESEKTLDGAVIGSIANVQGKPISQGKIRYGEYPGRAFVYLYAQNNEIFKVSARVFLVGDRHYQVSALMKQDTFDEKIANAFLGTFRIHDRHPLPESDSETETDSAAKPEARPESESKPEPVPESKSDSDKTANPATHE